MLSRLDGYANDATANPIVHEDVPVWDWDESSTVLRVAHDEQWNEFVTRYRWT